MPRVYRLELSEAQKAELTEVRNSHAKPYVRERAAAITKVSAGQSMRQVALNGLLRSHEPETVRTWIDRYLAEGLAGLQVRKGRGRKPSFSPSKQGRG